MKIRSDKLNKFVALFYSLDNESSMLHIFGCFKIWNMYNLIIQNRKM